MNSLRSNLGGLSTFEISSSKSVYPKKLFLIGEFLKSIHGFRSEIAVRSMVK